MTKSQTTWMAVLVLAASCVAAEQPEVWIPAQQAPDAPAAQAPGGQAGQQPGTQPAQPGTQPAQPGTQPAQPGTPANPPYDNNNDPRLDQPMQPINPDVPAPQTEHVTGPAIVPDSTPLNSPQELTLGTPGGAAGRSSMVPSIRFSQYGTTSSGGTGQGSEAITNLSGAIDLVRQSAHNSLTLDYTAGGTLYAINTYLNAMYQQAAVAWTTQHGRWTFSLRDSGSYLPESSFGFFGMQFAGGGGPATSGFYYPNQSILTLNSIRLSNNVSGETRYQINPRTSVHVSESWGILRSQGGAAVPLQNSDQYVGSIGVDRSFGMNTLGVAYSPSLFRYRGANQGFDTHSIQIAYGRRLTGKLALQISGGPQVVVFSNTGAASTTDATWNVRSGLTYQIGRTSLSTAFMRSATGGSGVLSGAETYQWDVSAGRQLGRTWNVSGDFGYARNLSLQAALSGVNTLTFNNEFAGMQLAHVLGRSMSLTFSYNLQHQTTSVPVCIGCGDSFTRHMFGVGFDWRGRPMSINPF